MKIRAMVAERLETVQGLFQAIHAVGYEAEIEFLKSVLAEIDKLSEGSSVRFDAQYLRGPHPRLDIVGRTIQIFNEKHPLTPIVPPDFTELVKNMSFNVQSVVLTVREGKTVVELVEELMV